MLIQIRRFDSTRFIGILIRDPDHNVDLADTRAIVRHTSRISLASLYKEQISIAGLGFHKDCSVACNLLSWYYFLVQLV